MLGAICGDIIGSIYEVNNIKSKEFQLFHRLDRYTDDSVMTCAIGEACYEYNKNKDIKTFEKNCIFYMQKFGRNHINAGYGKNFIYWLISDNPKPYNSFGNGSAMRVSPIAYISSSLNEAEKLAEISAKVSHNHPEGIKGAKSVAGAIWLLLNGKNKEETKKYICDNYYDLNFSLSEIRDSYNFDVSCQGSIPQAIVAFLESKNYEDAIRNAISIGGDSDTIAAITGSLAEAYYGVPEYIAVRALGFLDYELLTTVNKYYKIFQSENENLKCIK